jgi:preprotein translocase subunit YajC
MKKALSLLSIFFASSLSADQTPAAPVAAPDGGLTQTLVMVGIALGFFYFILWRPEQKRRKSLETVRSSMKKGDRVICMGLVGVITKIKEDTVVIRSAGSEMEFLKAAINEVQPGTGADVDA